MYVSDKNNYVNTLLLIMLGSCFSLFAGNIYASNLFDGWDAAEAHDTSRRIKGWVTSGANQETLNDITKRTNGLFGEGAGTWSYENNLAGDRFVSEANKALQAGKKTEAIDKYRAAAAHFGVARYPFMHSNTARKAYRKHNIAFYKYLELANIKIEQLRIPLEGKEILGNLYKPKSVKGTSALPLIVISGGIDTWKNELWDTIEPMLGQGFSVFAMDMPGTGESQWLLSPTSERVYARAIAHLKHRNDIDSNRIGVNLRSFAGHYAVKLALGNSDIKAAINVAGPVTFGDGELWDLPEFMLRTVGAGFGMDQHLFDDIEVGKKVLTEKLAAMSMLKLDLLKPAESQAAILTINGTEDPLVPTSEIFKLSNAGIKQEIWLYQNDGHCAGKNSHKYIPASAIWMKNQFKY